MHPGGEKAAGSLGSGESRIPGPGEIYCAAGSLASCQVGIQGWHAARQSSEAGHRCPSGVMEAPKLSCL